MLQLAAASRWNFGTESKYLGLFSGRMVKLYSLVFSFQGFKFFTLILDSCSRQMTRNRSFKSSCNGSIIQEV